MTNTTTDVPTPPTDNRGRVIHGSCLVHRVARGLTNLVVSQREGEIGLDPHAAGARKVTLDEDGARVLRSALAEWLG